MLGPRLSRYSVAIAAGIGWIFQSTPSRVTRDSMGAGRWHVPPDRHEAERSRGDQRERWVRWPLLAPGSRRPSAARCSPARSRSRRRPTPSVTSAPPFQGTTCGSMTPVQRPDGRGCARPDRRLSATSKPQPSGRVHVLLVDPVAGDEAVRHADAPRRRPIGIAVHSMPSGLNHTVDSVSGRIPQDQQWSLGHDAGRPDSRWTGCAPRRGSSRWAGRVAGRSAARRAR